MSKARDIFPLFLATVFGIGSSVWTFGPALKEQREQKDEELRGRSTETSRSCTKSRCCNGGYFTTYRDIEFLVVLPRSLVKCTG
ncbi:hypothetical protein CJF30_00004644 [Rutstroemia sp. NJR-2017a BBW]|nr:hypothetical protein CJF30_00004644 [Rutstroemia sp. NJR-2017a BBW]